MAADPRQRSVLVAERNRNSRELMATALRSRFDFASCEFGEDVLRRLQDSKPDVLILGTPIYVDLGLSRRYLLQELVWRGFETVVRRTIIVTTHPVDPDLVRRARDARVFAVMVQPFDMQALVDVAEACAAGPAADHSTLWIGIEPPLADGPRLEPDQRKRPPNA